MRTQEAKEGFARILIQPDPTLVRTPTVPALEYDSAPPLDPAALMGRLEGPYPAPVHELQQLNQPMVMNPSSRPLVHYAAATSTATPAIPQASGLTVSHPSVAGGTLGMAEPTSRVLLAKLLSFGSAARHRVPISPIK